MSSVSVCVDVNAEVISFNNEEITAKEYALFIAYNHLLQALQTFQNSPTCGNLNQLSDIYDYYDNCLKNYNNFF